MGDEKWEKESQWKKNKSTISRSFTQWSKLWETQVKTLLGLIYSNLRWKTLQGKWISENLTSSFRMDTFVFEENLPLKCCSNPTADWKGKGRWQGTSNSFYSTKSLSSIIIFSSSLSTMCSSAKQRMSLRHFPHVLILNLVLVHLLLSATDTFSSDSQIKVICQSTVRVGVITGPWLLL